MRERFIRETRRATRAHNRSYSSPSDPCYPPDIPRNMRVLIISRKQPLLKKDRAHLEERRKQRNCKFKRTKIDSATNLRSDTRILKSTREIVLFTIENGPVVIYLWGTYHFYQGDSSTLKTPVIISN